MINSYESTIPTKGRRPPQAMKFQSYSKRDADNLIRQGGDVTQTDILTRGNRPDDFYRVELKEEKFMPRLDKNTMAFEGYESRSKIRSIYRKDEMILNSDPYDLKKVDDGKKKTTKNSGKGVLLSMNK